ncbi:MAG: tRNA 2-thiouridine(34) synthase MnmA [Proteobacteria bacterium]|nr:tRNA 2-thiouridine(34) synthase MnmA [Pseudomonadota bacterium]
MTDPPFRTGLEDLPPGALVAVAFSGGIDSAVSARRIIERGLRVLACHLLLGPDHTTLDQARETARVLGLELHAFDMASGFEATVVRPFIDAYTRGETPSPCVACNPSIKFGLLWERVRDMGALRIATGHYAALGPGPCLVRPRDRFKDQTYFLSRLSPDMLARAAFPLAGLTKDEVREAANGLGLPGRPESQDICFLGGGDYRRFIESRLDPTAFPHGDIVDARGRVLGRHRGLIHYTVGQRRGLGLPGPEPFYVLSLDSKQNRVVIGPKSETHAPRLLARSLVWGLEPPGPIFEARVQIRSRHRPAPARVRLLPDDRAEVIFHESQSSITPGQAAVFYSDRRLLGAGWIVRRDR